MSNSHSLVCVLTFCTDLLCVCVHCEQRTVKIQKLKNSFHNSICFNSRDKRKPSLFPLFFCLCCRCYFASTCSNPSFQHFNSLALIVCHAIALWISCLLFFFCLLVLFNVHSNKIMEFFIQTRLYAMIQLLPFTLQLNSPSAAAAAAVAVLFAWISAYFSRMISGALFASHAIQFKTLSSLSSHFVAVFKILSISFFRCSSDALTTEKTNATEKKKKTESTINKKSVNEFSTIVVHFAWIVLVFFFFIKIILILHSFPLLSYFSPRLIVHVRS